MQRWAGTILAVAVLGLAGQSAFAFETDGPRIEGRLKRRREEISRKAMADELRFERARRRAQVRLEQEAMYERMGYSPSRPYTNTTRWALGLGQR